MLATYKAFLGNFRSCLMVVVVSQVSGIALLAQDAPSTKQVESGAIDFAHDIVPILRDKCARCHTNGTYKGGLSFDNRLALLESDVVQVGKANDSTLIERITSRDPDEQMPPEGARLSSAEIVKIRNWIDSGVKWETGFSFRQQTWKAPIAPRKILIPAEAGNPIDYLVDIYFKKNRVQWPPAIDDATFLRRVSLDLVGLLPSESELGKFCDDPSPEKHSKAISRLLERKSDFADHWLTFWNDHLRNDYAGTGYIDGGRKQITGWLYRALYENKPYDEFVRGLISPSPDSEGFIRGIQWRGNVNASQVRELQFAQNVSQVFLGENLKCASCHDSFINNWKLEDAYGLAAVLSDRPLEMYRCDKPTGKKVGPKFLWTQLGAIDASAPRNQRLQQVAELVTKKENGRFTRTIVNRIWKRMMGRGLVEPVDIMGNRPWSEELLDFLAVHLQENGYDLKKTMALIANSRIYQASSVATRESSTGDFLFRGPGIRRMTAEQFLDGVWQVTDGGPVGKRGPIPQVSSTGGGASPKKMLGKWLWNRVDSQRAPGNAEVDFVAQLDLSKKPRGAKLVITCDNEFLLHVNQKKIRQDTEWNSVELIDLKSHLKKGLNEIRVLAKNHTDSPNPAGLYVSLVLEGKAVALKWNTRVDKKLLPAVPVAQPQIWASSFPQILSLENAARGGGQVHRNRAAHVIADSLMRSLGRPNREQVVTTRDDQLSTLQALDLSNGERFGQILNEGATKISQRFESANEIIVYVYQSALARRPAPEELKILKEMIGETPEKESVADLLWSVFMLPEFQHVR